MEITNIEGKNSPLSGKDVSGCSTESSAYPHRFEPNPCMPYRVSAEDTVYLYDDTEHSTEPLCSFLPFCTSEFCPLMGRSRFVSSDSCCSRQQRSRCRSEWTERKTDRRTVALLPYRILTRDVELGAAGGEHRHGAFQ